MSLMCELHTGSKSMRGDVTSTGARALEQEVDRAHQCAMSTIITRSDYADDEVQPTAVEALSLVAQMTRWRQWMLTMKWSASSGSPAGIGSCLREEK